MRKKDQKNLIKVGMFLSALTFIMMVMIAFVGKENSFFDPKVELKAKVKTVANLKPGSNVELRGIRIGAVSRIDIISEEEILITLQITESNLKWIRQDSLIGINTAGLLGDKYLEIIGGSKDSPAFDPMKDELKSAETLDLKNIMIRGETIASKVERILDKVDVILVNMEDGKSLIKTMRSMEKASANIEKITIDLSKAPIISGLSKFDRIMTRVESGPGSVHSLIYDDGLHEDMRTLLGGAERNKVIKYFIRQSIEKSERKKPDTKRQD